MKKFLAKIIISALAIVMCLSAVGCSCGGSSWNSDDVTLKDWGKVVYNGGFVSETENYFYYINGLPATDIDNTFGVPVKGSLMAVKKSDIAAGKEDPERCVVVPKLLVAQDYTSGVFIYGDYVYYASPSTDRDSSGQIVNSQLEFLRTKLDGTDTTKFFKTHALSDNYRFVEANGVVYAIVYDSENSRLISYNTSTDTTLEIAKTDVETESMETFDSESFKFVDKNSCGEAVVVFANTVYSAKYDEAEAENNSSYSRTTADYNKVYAYKAGEESAKLVLNGESTQTFYNVKYIENGNVYYGETKTVSVNDEIVKAVSVANLYNGVGGVEVLNSSVLTDSSIKVSPVEIYTVNTESGAVRVTNSLTNDGDSEKTVAIINKASTLVKKQGDYIYYINGDTKLARIELNNVDAQEQVISDSTVPTDWYSAEIIGDYAFYSDNTALGCSYIKVVSLNADNLKEEEDVYFFDNVISLAKYADSDMAGYVIARIDNIEELLEDGKLVLDTDADGKVVLKDGIPTVEYVVKTRELYNGLTDEQKKTVGEDNLSTLENYEAALKLSQAFYGLNDFDNLTKEQKDALKDTAFATANAEYQALLTSGLNVKTVRGYVAGNLNWYFQIATKYFK